MLYVIKHKGGDPYWEYERFVRVTGLTAVSFVRSAKRYCTVWIDEGDANNVKKYLGKKFVVVPCKLNDEEIIKGLL